MRRLRIVLVVLAMICLTPSPRTEAGCNAIPSASNRSRKMVDPAAMTEFDGTRGASESPFVIPNERLRISQPCPHPRPFPSGNDTRTVVLVRPPKGDVRAIVLKSGAGPCTSDAFKQRCARAMGKSGTADCINIDPLKYLVSADVVDLEFPDPGYTGAAGARAAVAVFDQSQADSGTACGALIKSCSAAIGYDDVLACVDDLTHPIDVNHPCEGAAPDPIFPAMTLLPLTNDLKHVCYTGPAGLCDPKPSDELRYAVDQPGDLLLPMRWEDGLAYCKSQPNATTLEVSGEVKAPPNRALRIPDNVPNGDRNRWLESYTFDGKQNQPPFYTTRDDDPVSGFAGTTDEPFSVLRVGTFYGVCAHNLGEGCNHAEECPTTGDRCDPRCRGDSQQCPAHIDCAHGACGKNHDWTPLFRDGRWRVDRTPGAFCENNPNAQCNPACDANADCVSYRVQVGDCVPPRAVPEPPPSTFDSTPLGIHLADVSASAILARGSSGDAAAAIVPGAKLGSLGIGCRGPGNGNVLIVARDAECSTNGPCGAVCLAVGGHSPLPTLSVVGAEVRFLEQLPKGPAQRGRAVLRIADTERRTIVTIGEVLTDSTFDPLAVSPDGTSRVVLSAGRCVTSDGKSRTLGIPSYCNSNADCPGWATCNTADVVMLQDLAALSRNGR